MKTTKVEVKATTKINAENICITKMEYDVVDFINTKRVELGLNTLLFSETLILTANKNVQESVNKTYLSYAPLHSFIKFPDNGGGIHNYEPTSHFEISD